MREPWNDDLDLDWSERWSIFVGFAVVIAFVLGVTLIAGGS